MRKNIRRGRRATIVLLLALAFVGAVGRPARAVLLNWNNPAGGSAATASNWNPAQVPATTDNLVYALDTNYTVTYGLVLNQTFNNRIREGSVVFSYSSPHTTTGPLEIGACCADSAKLTITTGSVTVNAQIEIGDDSGTDGRLVLSDSDVSVVKAGAGHVLVGGGPTSGGRGRLDVSGGALLDIQLGDLSIGHNATPADGRVFVSGRSFNPSRSSTILVRGGFGNDIIVGNQGAGSLAVDAGGLVSTDGSILMAVGAGTVGGVTVRSTGFGSTLEAADDLTIAGAGTGVLNVLAGGTVTVGDLTRLASGAGTGTLYIGPGGLLATRRFEYSTGGFLDLNGGTLRIDGGDVDLDGHVLVIASLSGAPVLELRNGATMVLPSLTGDALLVAREGQGQLSLLSGSSCQIVNFGASIGRDAGSSGTVLVDGGSTLTTTSPTSSTFSVGVNGTGQVNVQGGGQFDTDVLQLGAAATGSGAVDVLGAGSRIDITSFLSLGGASGAAQGDGFLTISDGAAVQVANAGSNSTRIWNDGGVLNVYNGGTLTSAGGIDHRGVIQLGAGTITAATLAFNAAATLEGNGTVAARINAANAGSVITANGGPLTLGNAADAAGFANQGTLSVGAESVTLADADGPVLGNVALGGGTLAYSGVGTLAAGKTLSGHGLVTGGVTNAGTIAASDAGLRFDGIVTNPGATIGGTLITFLDDGGFTGSGNINSRVDGDPGSIITATGTLGLGNAASATGVVLDGELHVGAQSVVLRDSDGIDLGSLTALAGGALGYAGELRVGVGDHLTGTGVVSASLRNNGLITPGSSAGALGVGNNYVNSLFGVLEVELGNHATAENDRLNVTGTALLEGGTLQLAGLPSFNADAGDEFTIITAASVSGTFGFVSSQDFPPGTQLEVVYNPTSVVVRVTASAAIEAPLAAPEALPAALAFTGIATPDGAAAFELGLPSAADAVAVSLYDIAGRQVARLHDGPLAAGWHRLAAPAARLARGVYFGRSEIAMDGQRETRTARVVLMK